MSQENVELVARLLPRPGQDLLRLVRDDDVWAAFTVAVTPILQPDFECVAGGMPDGEKTYIGLDGFRAAWRDWTAPWATYRSEVDETVDLGDRVLVLFHDFARFKGTTEEVNQTPANIWTVRDGKIARWQLYPDWRDALPALGWDEQAISKENVEVVRRHFEAWNHRDKAGYVASFRSDAEIDWTRARALFRGVYRGREQQKAFWDEFWSTFEDSQLEIHSLTEAGSELVVWNTAHMWGRDGIEVTARSALVFTVEDGEITCLRLFQERAEALEAAGLSE
jgi:ketosteroid isomerase-like protein